MVPVKEGKERCTDCEEDTEGIEILSESTLGGVVTTGNPNSLAAMSGEVIRQMMAEAGEFKADDAGSHTIAHYMLKMKFKKMKVKTFHIRILMWL